MLRVQRCLIFLIQISVFAAMGCGSASIGGHVLPAGNKDQIVTVADLHFNPLYDPSLYASLVAADPSQWAGIYQGSTVKAPTGGGTDTNYPLLVLALASMKQNMEASPVVLCTGDLLGHSIPQMFYTGYYGTPHYPTPDATAIAAMQRFIDKTFAFVAIQIRGAAGNAPVIYAPGNIDTYGPGYGPEGTFLTDNAETVYSQFLMGGVDQATFLSTFLVDGYYAAQPLGSGLRVITLNTNSFVAGAPSESDAQAELAWLDAQLAAAQAAKEKVWILMHVPPGANDQTIAQNVPSPSDIHDNNVAMMWDANLQDTFVQKLGKYPGLVTMMLAGHTHMDEFRILPTGDVLEQLPGISPCFGNNPAYKVLTVTANTFTPTDYQSYDYNLATMPAQFGSLYRFTATYGGESTLGASLRTLYPQVSADKNTRNTYALLYASGSRATNPVTLAPWNPMNETNWPIFTCTIGEMDGSDYIGCLNPH
ncbi:MAG TPA: metallophosphoesterase [Acidobacteriaceae bacterium]|jgi:hypothetical protein